MYLFRSCMDTGRARRVHANASRLNQFRPSLEKMFSHLGDLFRAKLEDIRAIGARPIAVGHGVILKGAERISVDGGTYRATGIEGRLNARCVPFFAHLASQYKNEKVCLAFLFKNN